MTKTCATCDKTKPVSEFSYRKDRKRYYNDCKACRNAKGSKQISRQTKEKQAIESNPHGFLAADVIVKALRDWEKYSVYDKKHKGTTDYSEVRFLIRQKGYDTIRDELLAFFECDWFEELAGMAGSDAEYLRKYIGYGTQQTGR